MGTRNQLELAIAGTLANVKIVDSPRAFADVEAHIIGILQFVRVSIKPASNSMGQAIEDFELWVIEPGTDPDEIENDLDALLDDVLATINPLPWLVWESAIRETHITNRSAYKITLTIITDINTEETP